MKNRITRYAEHYSKKNFWSKLKKFALRMGRELLEKTLLLFYTLVAKDTPAWAKTVIISALGYLILPADAIPDITPIVGFSDDLGAILAALATVGKYVTPEIQKKAKDKAGQWFDRDCPEQKK